MTMQTASPLWLDAQYNNRARVPEAVQHLQRWAADSALARQHLQATGQAVLNLPYMGEGANPADAANQLDVFTPPPGATPPEGGWPVLLFIHGGYWRALDKADHSFLAPPFVANGACVVVPNYALCPAVGVSHITRQMVAAVVWAHRHVAEHGGNPQRITVVGHSAGGQLVGMLLATDWLAVGRQLGVALPLQPLQHGVSISGLFDMELIRQTPFLADLGLSPEEAASQSPALLPAPSTPGPRGRLTTVVGGDESDEFKRQNRLIQQAWGSDAVPVCEELPGLNHFSVVEELVKPGSRLSALIHASLMA